MTRFAFRHYAFPGSPASRFGAWGGAFLAHAVAVLVLLLSWPQAREGLARVNPIEVRLLEPAPPSSPARPLPARPARVPPAQAARPPEGAAPAPVTPVPAPVVAPMSAPEVVLATTGPTLAVMVTPPMVVADTGPVPAEVSRPASPTLEPLLEARFDAKYLSNPIPTYPLASRRLGESGVVRLHVQVGADGQALQVELKSSSGFPRLDQAALDTVARWRFVPARRGTVAVVSWVAVPIVFSLN